MSPTRQLTSTPVLGRLPRSVRRSLRAPLVVWRHRHLRRSDAYLTHYPKSGSTWLRFLLVNLARPDLDVDFEDVRALLPYVGSVKGAIVFPFGGRLVHSHEPLVPRVGDVARVIALVRDPRDVCASYFAHALRHGWPQEAFNTFFEAFLVGEIDNHGSWQEHVRRLVAWQDRPNMTVLRYEDLRSDTAKTLAEIAGQLGLPTTTERLGSAVAASSRQRMRQLEHTIANRPSTARPFVRRERATGWGELASPELEHRLVAKFGAQMEAVGYAP